MRDRRGDAAGRQRPPVAWIDDCRIDSRVRQHDRAQALARAHRIGVREKRIGHIRRLRCRAAAPATLAGRESSLPRHPNRENDGQHNSSGRRDDTGASPIHDARKYIREAIGYPIKQHRSAA
jgi:hypothetical protein